MRMKLFNNVLMEEAVIHTVVIPSYTDFYKFKIDELGEWRDSEKGKWLLDRVQDITEYSYKDVVTMNQIVRITGFLKPVDKTFMLLKWPENKS